MLTSCCLLTVRQRTTDFHLSRWDPWFTPPLVMWTTVYLWTAKQIRIVALSVDSGAPPLGIKKTMYFEITLVKRSPYLLSVLILVNLTIVLWGRRFTTQPLRTALNLQFKFCRCHQRKRIELWQQILPCRKNNTSFCDVFMTDPSVCIAPRSKITSICENWDLCLCSPCLLLVH